MISYFSGLMVSLMIIGLGISAAMFLVLFAAGVPLRMSDVGFITIAPIVDAAVASMILTRVKVKPGAFSPGMLLVLFVTFVIGTVTAFASSAAVNLIGDSSLEFRILQVGFIGLVSILAAYVGHKGTARLARGFRFSS